VVLDVNQERQKARTPGRAKERHGKAQRPTRSAGSEKGSKEVFKAELEDGTPSTLSFADYLAHAAAEQWDHTEDRELEDGWESPLFYFVRLVKAHPDMAAKTAKQALRAVESVMRTWRHAIPPQGRYLDDWAYWFETAEYHDYEMSREVAHVEFLDVWDKVRVLPGHSPLDNALEQAKRKPLNLLPEVRERRSDGYLDFVSVAGWLQVGVGDRNILLPVEELAGPLGVTPMTISRYRTWAVKDGYLWEVKPYKRPDQGKGGKATEYRFDVRKWDCLLDLAPWAKGK
jgi:hypothetical protein